MEDFFIKLDVLKKKERSKSWKRVRSKRTQEWTWRYRSKEAVTIVLTIIYIRKKPSLHGPLASIALKGVTSLKKYVGVKGPEAWGHGWCIERGSIFILVAEPKALLSTVLTYSLKGWWSKGKTKNFKMEILPWSLRWRALSRVELI